jgi:hypothetical protein
MLHILPAYSGVLAAYADLRFDLQAAEASVHEGGKWLV